MLKAECSVLNDNIKVLRSSTTCSVCGKKFKVLVKKEVLENSNAYPFTHVILHGNPLHAHVIYIDKNGAIRGRQSSNSLQIDRTSSTFQELVKWWSIPDEGV
ncbi:MAG: hypothetical protein ACTSVI_06835 [Promethearchaeota archaeon]